MLPDVDLLADEWRWCVYCRADCWPEPENQRHADSCPTVTGVYPVLESERGPDGEFGRCPGCSTQLVPGDWYVLRRVAADPASEWALCLGCGATGRRPVGDAA